LQFQESGMRAQSAASGYRSLSAPVAPK